MIDSSTLARHGPWACEACGDTSEVPYRCQSCGYEMTGSQSTAGREEVTT